MIIILLVLFYVAGEGFSARILAVSPFPGKSHQLFSTSILTALAGGGHQVFEYSPFPPKKPVPNLTHIEVHTRFEKTLDSWDYETMKQLSEHDSRMFMIRRIWKMNYLVVEDTFKDKNIQKLLKSDENFDLVITESSFGEEALLVFGHRFSAPAISIEPFFLWSAVNRDAGNSLSIASVPELMPFVATDQMTFMERFKNCIAVTSSLFFYYNSHIPRQDAILKKYYPNAPPVSDLISNVSLYFTNSHPTAINYIRPYTPNIIPVGGIHISPDRHTLPQDVQNFMDSASDGVIYFSLGTVVPIHHLPKEVLQSFINVFKRLPQRVLWKIDFDQLPPTSDNVKVVKWVPQPGVLGHPKCAVFMTHGGLFSQQEAIYAGVPTVGIPFFADQPYNIQYNEHRKIGVKLDFFSLSEENIYSALATILNNPLYKENAQRMSRIYRDRVMSPSDSALFWAEYVLRHSGAPHLRPFAAYLPWYQLVLLDVAATVLVIAFLLLAVMYMSVKKLLSLFVTDSTEKAEINKKKNM